MANKITAEQLKQKLAAGPLHFTFRKVDNTIRKAYGTTNLSNIPATQHPTGGVGPNNCIPFYDLESQSWKSCPMYTDISI